MVLEISLSLDTYMYIYCMGVALMFLGCNQPSYTHLQIAWWKGDLKFLSVNLVQHVLKRLFTKNYAKSFNL